jgi:EmrB/QacA subfamily drug resistance transporter
MSASTTSTSLFAGNGKWVLLSCIVASSMAFIDSNALGLAMDAIQEDLNATGAQLLWVSNAYLIFLSALILVGGSLGDHFGRKRMFGYGIGLFTFASLLCGVAPTVELLILARALKGIGGALMVPGSLSIISAYFGPRRGEAIGTWSAFSTITTILGPLVGGALVSAGLWRLIFFINLPLAAIALYALSYVPESRDEAAPPQLDILGAFLATLGLGGITYGFIEVAGRGFSDPVILAAFGLGLAGLVGFVVVEGRSSHPMMPLRLFQSRTFSGTNAMTLFLYGALAGALFFYPLNLIQVQGYDPGEAAPTLLPFALLLALMSRNMGRLSDRIGPRLPLTLGSAVVGCGFLLMSLPGLTDGVRDFPTTYLPAILCMGVGMGIVVSPLTAAVMGSVSSHQAGVASGVNNAVARSANVLAIAILGAIALTFFKADLQDRTAEIAMSAEQRAFLGEEAANLAEAEMPPNLSAATQVEVEQQVDLAFVQTFRLTNYIAAGLCFVSALLSFVMVDGGKKQAVD